MDKLDTVELFCRLTLSNDVFLFGFHLPLVLHILKSIAICIWSAVLFRGILGIPNEGGCLFVLLSQVLLAVSIVEGFGFVVAIARWGWRVIHFIWKRSKIPNACRVEFCGERDSNLDDSKCVFDQWCCRCSSFRVMIFIDTLEHLFMIASLCFLPVVVSLSNVGFQTSTDPEAVKWFPFLSAFAISYCVMDGVVVAAEGLYCVAQCIMLLCFVRSGVFAIMANMDATDRIGDLTPTGPSLAKMFARLYGLSLADKTDTSDAPDDTPTEFVVRCDKHFCCSRVSPVDAESPGD